MVNIPPLNRLRQLETKIKNEKYFRPSKYTAINTINVEEIITKSAQEKGLILPAHYFNNPENTIINFFSFLREANQMDYTRQGCGSVGYGKFPYPLAYQFLSSNLQVQIPYEKFLQLLKNYLHVNLIKMVLIPYKNNNIKTKNFLIEMETIEGTSFNYYSTFIEAVKEKNSYKINMLDFQKEDFLCAPYHYWQHNAEMVVEIKYGNWCKLLKNQYPTIYEGYKKWIIFDGKDGNQYMIEFVELTNGTDIQIAEYKKNMNQWQLTHLSC